MTAAAPPPAASGGPAPAAKQRPPASAAGLKEDDDSIIILRAGAYFAFLLSGCRGGGSSKPPRQPTTADDCKLLLRPERSPPGRHLLRRHQHPVGGGVMPFAEPWVERARYPRRSRGLREARSGAPECTQALQCQTPRQQSTSPQVMSSGCWMSTLDKLFKSSASWTYLVRDQSAQCVEIPSGQCPREGPA